MSLIGRAFAAFPFLIFTYGHAIRAQAQQLQISNFRQVTPDIFRGGRPSASDLGILSQQYNIRTDIDLENDDSIVQSENSTANSLKMQFLGTEMSPYSYPSDAEINSVLAQLQDPNNFPIFVHCQYGDDRTGLIIGLYRVLVQGWAPADAYTEMLDDGFHPILLGLTEYFRHRTGYDGSWDFTQ